MGYISSSRFKIYCGPITKSGETELMCMLPRPEPSLKAKCQFDKLAQLVSSSIKLPYGTDSNKPVTYFCIPFKCNVVCI